jgi:hydroxymethylglutaryl-CoA lyase
MKLIECPRDAMQGLHDYLSVEDKVRYINAILKVGFDTIDAGSFVSPKAIPQMKDTAEVLSKLDMSSTKSKLLVITANKRGAEEAVQFDEVSYLGFPFSISETFQKRNINSTIEDSLRRLDKVQNLCVKNNKKMVTYFSMAFGNPYGDEWSPEIVANWVEKLIEGAGVDILSLSDTIGTSKPDSIKGLFEYVIPNFPEVEIGAHLHTTPDTWKEKIGAAIESGCKRFDGAIKGFGGCPMATDDLTGNMATENIISYLNENNIEHGLNEEAFNEAMMMSLEIFPN